MGKKKGGKSSGAVSQGIHSNVRQGILNLNRQEYRKSGLRLLNQRRAWAKGKNVVLTIENPNKNETDKPYLRVNARDVWGSPKNRQ
jgi:hypothetical protein